MADGVTEDDEQLLLQIWKLAGLDVELARAVAHSPFLEEPFRQRDSLAIHALRFLHGKYPDLLADMTRRDWFKDGLDDDEAALLVVFGSEDTYFTPEDFRPLLTRHRLESRSVMFPIRGEVLATDIQFAQGRQRDDMTSTVEAAAVEIEKFMGIEFPANDLILALISCRYSPRRSSDESCKAVGLYRWTHMIADPIRAIKDARGTLIHEVAHYYWNSGSPVKVPVWVYEGGANFLDSYVQVRLYGETWESRKRRVSDRVRRCETKGIDSVQEIVDKLAELGRKKLRAFELYNCNYYYGETLLIHLYEAIGEDAFRSAWQDIYVTSQSRAQERRDMTEEEIYRAFRKHTPADRLESFEVVYAKWHGGDFSAEH